MSGALVMWWCMCIDAAGDPDTLPDRCPGHHLPRAATYAGPWPATGGPTPGHECPVHPCETNRLTPTDRTRESA